MLTEPGSVVAKAWEQIDRMVLRAPRNLGSSRVRVALVTGAGPIGMLAALLGRQRGYQVHVFDRVTAGPKPVLVAALGATYHHGPVGALDLRPDVVLECTGAGELVVELAGKLAQAGVMCLIGISSGQRLLPVNMSRVGAVDGAGELAGLRYGERGAPPLRAGRRGAGAGRPGLARRPDQPPRSAVRLAGRARQAAR